MKVLFEVETSKTHYNGVIKEEHYSSCDSKGNFLFHFTLDQATKDMLHAKKIATKIYESLEETTVAIGGDSTNVNTGWKGGVITHLKNLLGRKCVWLVWVCMCLEVLRS